MFAFSTKAYFNDPAVQDPPAVKDPPKTFTQEQVNAFIAEDKKKLQSTNQQLVKQLQEIQQTATLTAQQKEELETRINDLESQYKTKEQLALEEKGKIEKQLKTQLDTITTERETWKGRFTNASIEREIIDAAVSEEAFNPAQLVALLKPNTRLVEEGGNFKPLIKFKTAEGKDLDLSPKETIQKMKEEKTRFGNLFKSNVSGGIGGSGSVSNNGTSTDIEPSKMTGEQYAKWRKEQGFKNR